MLAVDAVKVVDENVDKDEAVLLLGHSLKIKAERMQHNCMNSYHLCIFQHT